MERLNFMLPNFVRLSWSSSKAKDKWGPRISAVSSALIRISNYLREPYPSCCREAYFESVDREFRDQTWIQYRVNGLVEVDGPWQTNALLRPLGLYLDFTPCSPECPYAVDFIDRALSLSYDLGAQQHLDYLKEVLSWPMSWNALNGIAIVHTPVFRMSYATDAIKGEHVVHRHGTTFPEEGARGLRFPFSMPRKGRK